MSENKIGQWLRPAIEVSTAHNFCQLSQDFVGDKRVIHIEKQNIERVIEALQAWKQTQ